MTKALVTGGAGFIGSHLVARLAREGFEVIVVDDLSWGSRTRLEGTRNVRFIESNVLQLPKILDDIRGATHIFHLAALISAYESLEQPDAYLNTNVNGLLRVIEVCKTLSSPRLVFASTSGVYGNLETPPKTEDDLPRPATVYAASKLMGEQLLAMYRPRVRYEDISLRFFNVYGPGQSSKHPYANVACRFARAAALRESVELYGDGAQTRDFIFVDDVVDAIMAVGLGPVKSRLYNVGTGTEASIARLLQLAQEAAGTAIDIVQRDAWPNDIRSIRADIGRIQKDFGFTPRVGFEEGLQRTVDFFREVGASY